MTNELPCSNLERYVQVPKETLDIEINKLYTELGKLRVLLLFNNFTTEECMVYHKRLRNALDSLEKLITQGEPK